MAYYTIPRYEGKTEGNRIIWETAGELVYIEPYGRDAIRFRSSKSLRGGGGSSPGTPFSGGVVWGEAVLLTGYPACGPHIGRSVTARPPAGRAGGVGGYPLGKGREEPFGFPLSPPVNKPLLPPARAGGRAMRRWSWRPQARPIPTQPPSPVPPPENGVPRGRNLLPLGVLSPISSKK